MPESLTSLKTDFDVVVIGGGVNGTGVARDCALRGLRVALFERNDLAFGASGNSSGMIHGGVRYLSANPSVTRSSCLDSGYIQRIAPHLLFRIPFLMPVDKAPGARVMFTLIDAFFGAYDRFQPLKRGKPHTRLTADEARQLEPGLADDMVGAITFDEWGIDGARLCLLNALDASENGAQIFNHHSVEQILRSPDHGNVEGVRVRDRLTESTFRVSAKSVVNATGAWAPVSASLAGLSPKSALVRPGKGIHVVFDRRLVNYAITATTIDGRQVFIEPWENVSVLGTTDSDYYGDLDNVFATSDEVRYLVQAVAKVFPSIRQARIIGTFAGVRPTLYAYGPVPDALSREHEIVDHNKDSADGLYSMIGGKLASYRIFAEEMTDILARRLHNHTPCTTHSAPLPGGDESLDASALASQLGIDVVSARRLIYRHGSRANRIVDMALKSPRGRLNICACEAISEAEIRYVAEHEFVKTVEDLGRRLRLGFGPCGGMRCILDASRILADVIGLSPDEARQQAYSFMERLFRQRIVGMGPIQARQESLALASLRAQLGLKQGDVQ